MTETTTWPNGDGDGDGDGDGHHCGQKHCVIANCPLVMVVPCHSPCECEEFCLSLWEYDQSCNGWHFDFKKEECSLFLDRARVPTTTTSIFTYHYEKYV